MQTEVHFISLGLINLAVRGCMLEGKQLAMKIKFCFPHLYVQLPVSAILRKVFQHNLSQSTYTLVDH